MTENNGKIDPPLFALIGLALICFTIICVVWLITK